MRYYLCMVQYIVPLASLLLTFLSSLACLRFIFSRQGLFWIIPFLVSALLSVENALSLFAGGPFLMPTIHSFRFFPLILSFCWYMMVITFHYALKKKVSRNRFISDMRKNYSEARFLEKIEKRNFFRFSRHKKEAAINSYYQPEVRPFDNIRLDEWDS